jgi:COP9 signalosome complex subunit 7
MRTPRELEDLVISAIYAGLVSATLDPYHQNVLVSSVSPLRDLEPDSIPSMLDTLSQWSSRCTSTLADLEKQIAGIKAEAAQRHKEEVEWNAEVESLVDGKNKDDAKGGVGGFVSSVTSGMGRRLGGGQGKRAIHDGYAWEDDMDLDEEDDDDVPQRSTRAAKKRGYHGMGGK